MTHRYEANPECVNCGALTVKYTGRCWACHTCGAEGCGV